MDITAPALDPPLCVAFVLIDGFALMSYASAMEPLRASNVLGGRRHYDIRHLTLSGQATPSSSGALVPATDDILNPDPTASITPDLILLVAGSDWSAGRDERLYRWLRLQAERGVLIGGVSAGPLLLAEAGIMSGRRMTVHWEHLDELLAIDARLSLERSLFVRDRDRLTCAGGSAALDMMHALIAEHQGSKLAEMISEWFMHTTIRPGELAQRASIAERYQLRDRTLIAAIGAMENHLADPLALDQLASLSGCGARQLNRRFDSAFGTSAIRFYRELRLRKVQSLLQSTDWSVQQVAEATGFSSVAHLGHACRQYLGRTASQLRGGPSL